ncbi:hypothetical protein Q73_14565 [Bacillus coahuilensis m2-6]|uniref:O-antigen ligase family protein n=1 Tax=Bacillus coahuilensis TaxID=408580 RepID=UPI00075064FF|nr:O-antigen ligase family protein [Bacillus coahuilensis]KUP04847.1 hypothetical protein Q73_14565 [Bacillus coahuilensis m2-6]
MNSLKRYSSLEFSILLCFILPPIGIILVLASGLNTLWIFIKEKKPLLRSLNSWFFSMLLIASLGAALSMREWAFVGSSLLVLGYWGVYLRVVDGSFQPFTEKFRNLVVFGGVYNCFIGLAFKGESFPLLVSLFTGNIHIANMDETRLVGAAYNPNFAVYLLLMAVAFQLAQIFHTVQYRKFSSLWWQLLLLFFLSYGVLETGSRAGFFTLIILYMILAFRFGRIAIVAGISTAILVCQGALRYLPRFSRMDDSMDGRQAIWRKSIEIWEQHPLFGVTPVGFGQEYVNAFYEWKPHAHNIFIGMFAEFGMLGGVAFLIMVIHHSFKWSRLFAYEVRDKQESALYMLVLPIILLTGLVDQPLFSPQLGVITVVLLGCWDRYSSGLQLEWYKRVLSVSSSVK